MCKKTFLTAVEAEMEMQLIRDNNGFYEKIETETIKNIIKSAKRNNMIGDKLQIVVDPMYIHIPSWQRRINKAHALSIGNNYNKHKWDVPKVLVIDNMLYVIDGQHRIYGAFKGNREEVVVEVMDCTLQEAIDLFITQSKDRKKMQPMDVYQAAIAGGKPEYIGFKDLCNKYNIRIKGDENLHNEVGTWTAISDGINLYKGNAELLESMLILLQKLKWNGYSENKFNKQAYSAKIIRVLKRLYAYYESETREMEKALISNCKGADFFKTEIVNKEQSVLFDFLSNIVEGVINNPFIRETKNHKRKENNINVI